MDRRRRKLLVASLGVAAVSYVACSSGKKETSGNLIAPPEDAAPSSDADDQDAVSPLRDAAVAPFDVVANLVAPPEDPNQQ